MTDDPIAAFAAPLTRSVRLPHGFTAEFTIAPDGALTVAWTPDLPRLRSRRAQRRLVDAYRRARDAFLREIGTVTGGSVGILEFGGEQLCRLSVIDRPTRH